MAKQIQLRFFFYYLLASGVGICILWLNALFLKPVTPQAGEYYYSNLLRTNYTYLSASLFFVVGLIAGYRIKINPWLTGFAMIAAFPIIAMYEATIYRGSHNLIPLEFAVHFLYALPAILGVYIGKFIERKSSTH